MTDKIRKDLESAGFVEVYADVDLEYGGIFIKDEKYWFDVIRITDLVSACGADGQIMVEALTTDFDQLDKNKLKSVLSFTDSKRLLTSKYVTKAYKRLLLAADMVGYGLYDPVDNPYHGPNTPFIAILDRVDYRESREKWEVNVKGWGQAAFRRAVNHAIDALI